METRRSTRNFKTLMNRQTKSNGEINQSINQSTKISAYSVSRYLTSSFKHSMRITKFKIRVGDQDVSKFLLISEGNDILRHRKKLKSSARLTREEQRIVGETERRNTGGGGADLLIVSTGGLVVSVSSTVGERPERRVRLLRGRCNKNRRYHAVR